MRKFYSTGDQETGLQLMQSIYRYEILYNVLMYPLDEANIYMKHYKYISGANCLPNDKLELIATKIKGINKLEILDNFAASMNGIDKCNKEIMRETNNLDNNEFYKKHLLDSGILLEDFILLICLLTSAIHTMMSGYSVPPALDTLHPQSYIGE